MRLPIDTAGMQFYCGSAPEPVRDFETKRARTDDNGVPLFSVKLVAMSPDGTEIILVKIAGEPKGVQQGMPVRVQGLVAWPWSMGDRSGVSFKATRIEAAPASATGQATSANSSRPA